METAEVIISVTGVCFLVVASPVTVLVAVSSDHRELADEIAEQTVYDVQIVSTERAVRESLPVDSTVDCLVATQDHPAGTALDLLERVRETDPSLPFVVLAPDGSEQLASDAFAADADDYVRSTRRARRSNPSRPASRG